jgi:putative flippase GtrA
MASVTQFVDILKGEYGQKAAKYAAVSVVNVIVGQSMLILANKVFGWTFVESNVFAVTVSAFPAYVLSRRWIWQKKGNNHFWKEVVPFWSIAFLGLGMSTGAAALASTFSDSTLVLMVANLSAFGLLWVAKFFVLDRVLFTDHTEPLTDDAFDALVDEIRHHDEHVETPE